MLNTLSFSAEPSILPAVVLRVVWHVDADESYCVNHRTPDSGVRFVAIRTLSGTGEIHLVNQQSFVLSHGTLLFLPLSNISHYRCKHDRWHFYWFEFSSDRPHEIPFFQILEIPIALCEDGILTKCSHALNATAGGRMAMLAQAQFLHLLLDWLQKGACPNMCGKISPDDLSMLLAEGMRQGVSVSELARQSCMCDRSFRAFVKQHTGKSPKKFMLDQAMDAALIMLQTTDLSVSEIASDIGFVNALYFSRAFRSRFGIQPSKARRLQTNREKPILPEV